MAGQPARRSATVSRVAATRAYLHRVRAPKVPKIQTRVDVVPDATEAVGAPIVHAPAESSDAPATRRSAVAEVVQTSAIEAPVAEVAPERPAASDLDAVSAAAPATFEVASDVDASELGVPSGRAATPNADALEQPETDAPLAVTEVQAEPPVVYDAGDVESSPDAGAAALPAESVRVPEREASSPEAPESDPASVDVEAPARRARLLAPGYISFRYAGRVLHGVITRIQGKRRLIHVLADPLGVLDQAGGPLGFLAWEISVIGVEPIVTVGWRRALTVQARAEAAPMFV